MARSNAPVMPFFFGMNITAAAPATGPAVFICLTRHPRRELLPTLQASFDEQYAQRIKPAEARQSGRGAAERIPKLLHPCRRAARWFFGRLRRRGYSEDF